MSIRPPFEASADPSNDERSATVSKFRLWRELSSIVKIRRIARYIEESVFRRVKRFRMDFFPEYDHASFVNFVLFSYFFFALSFSLTICPFGISILIESIYLLIYKLLYDGK